MNEFLDMYSDEAILIRKQLDQGKEMKLTGLQYKKIVKQISAKMTKKEKNNDKARLTNEKYEVINETSYKIMAHRYSTKKCFNDKNYALIVSKNKKGVYQIVQELSEGVYYSKCTDSPNKKPTQLASIYKRLESEFNKNMPFMLDSGTRMEQAKAKGKVFEFKSTFINLVEKDMSKEDIKKALLPQLKKQACSPNSTFQRAITMGGVFSYIYKYRTGKLAFKADINSCN